ncbi:Uncharacterised protein [uncultured archaeon]|nr:Uncharacterised protein [uncultured archaeon]
MIKTLTLFFIMVGFVFAGLSLETSKGFGIACRTSTHKWHNNILEFCGFLLTTDFVGDL